MSDTLDQRLKAACNANFDTQCFADAVKQWHDLYAYNDEQVSFLNMTLEQRMWVTRRAQELKCNS